MATFSDQLRQVLRRLGRAPLFTMITLITLGVGVGANTVIFSVLEGVLLKPLPYPHPEQLIGVWYQAPGVGITNLNMSPSIYFIDREQSTTFQDIGVYDGDSLSVTGAGEPEQVRGLDVSDGTLPMLGVKPALGRLFTREDDSPSAPDTVLLSYGYWRQKFGGATSVIGRSITVDGKPREIIGVLPQGFHFLDYEDASLVVPFKWDRSKIKLGNFSYQAMARLKPGVTMAQASADVARMLPIANRSFPAPEGFSVALFEKTQMAPNLRPLKQDVVGDIGKVLWVLMGSIAMVLLIACANVANLLLVRVDGRRQELAIRAALGAGWGRIALELMLESVVLGLLGSLLGLALAFAALQVLVALAPAGLPRIHEIGIDLPVLLFTFAIAMFSSLLFGSIPIFKYAGAHLNTGLREGGRALSQSRQQHRARNVLVVVQVGLALVLLICSGLMIRTFRALMHVPPGFTGPDAVQTFRFYVPETEIPDSDRERLVRMDQDLLGKLGAIPGVSSVSFSSAIPMDGRNSMDILFAEDRAYAEGELPPVRRFKFVSPGFLATMGTALIAGRDITWEDTYQRIPVAMISESFAKEYWRDARSALGKRIRVGSTDDWRQIVGVVGDVYDDGVDKPSGSSVYWPVMMDRFEGQKEMLRRGVGFVIRSPRAGSQSFLDEVRATVWSVDPNIPLANVHTLGYFYTQSMARTSFTLVMLAVAGAMALLLGIVGIYGVIAYSVSQRTREIGIRMALGAQRKALVGMFVQQGLWLAGVGILCGLAAAFAVMRLMSSLLFKVSPVDPVTYGAVTLAVVLTAYLACYLPSRRAATVDPVDALRAE
ncbi:MAG TPA: ABC transporter permease [Candidatus Acidoferrales bacterium]|jgi:predicted permease|nr:ABC transporter permease [Candidatus Acidoferrales bacterium]